MNGQELRALLWVKAWGLSTADLERALQVVADRKKFAALIGEPADLKRCPDGFSLEAWMSMDAAFIAD